MKTIFYSLAGEGLGHTGRTYALIEELTSRNPELIINVFTFGEAYDFFKSQNYPYLHKIDGIQFGRKYNKVNYLQTLKNVDYFLSQYSKNVEYISQQISQSKPVLTITDFEPILPRVAKAHNIPVISIDNQHKFSRCSSYSLSFGLRLYCKVTGWFVEKYIPNPDYTIISTFYKEIPKGSDSTKIVGSFLRKEFVKQEIKDDGFILLYYKKSVGEQILNLLKKINMPIIVYGHKKIDIQEDNITYKPLSYESFANDLASCHCVFSAAGNQLLGETLYFGKRIFSVPEPNQYEQYVNCEYLSRMWGSWCQLKDLTFKKVVDFLLRDDSHKIRKQTENGVVETAQMIEKYINMVK